MKTLIEKTSDKLVNAFLKNKIISPLPLKFTKKLKDAEKFIAKNDEKVRRIKKKNEKI